MEGRLWPISVGIVTSGQEFPCNKAGTVAFSAPPKGAKSGDSSVGRAVGF